MKLFYGRPLCFGCVGAVAAAFFCAFAGITAAFITAGAAAVFAVLTLIFIKPREGVDRRLYLFLLFALIAAVSLSSAIYYSDKESRTTDGRVFITGYADPSVRSGNFCKIRITSVDGKPTNTAAYADFGNYSTEEFAKFSAYGRIVKVDGENGTYLKGRGIFYQTELASVSFAGTERGASYYLYRIREYITSRFYAVSGRGDLYSCLFLGRRDLAPSGIASDFKDLGITHMLAVSGLHVVALLAGLEFVLTRTAGRRKYVYVLLAVTALFYAALAGFSGSVVRASIMYFIMSAGKALDMKSDGITGLSLSAALILFVCPNAVYDIGFLLSVSAAAGIILIGAPAARALGNLSAGRNAAVKALLYVASSFSVTLSALVFTMPAAAAGYGKAVFVSLLANLTVAPFIMILLYACPYMLVLSFVPFLGRIAGAFCDGISEIAERIAHALTALPPLEVSVKYGFVIYLIIAFAAAAALFAAVGITKRRYYTVLCLAFVFVFVCVSLIYNAVFSSKNVLIVGSSEKGGMAAFCSRGRCTVFDISDGTPAYALSEELLKHGVTEVDYVCASDFTSYHIQSVPDACSAFRVKKIYLPDSPGALLCAELCRKEAVYYEKAADSVFECGKISVTVSHAEAAGEVFTSICFGDTYYSDAVPLIDKKTVIYGHGVIDAADASFSAETVYLPEKYKDTEEINENTIFYGKTAVLELK